MLPNSNLFSFFFLVAVLAPLVCCCQNSTIILRADLGDNSFVQFSQQTPDSPFAYELGTCGYTTIRIFIDTTQLGDGGSMWKVGIVEGFADSDPTECNPDSLGGLYDPQNLLQQSTYSCNSQGTTCAVGDLSTRVPSFSGSAYHTVQNLPLYGFNGIVARTLVLYDINNSRIRCARILPLEDYQPTVLTASFSGDATGQVVVVGYLGFTSFGATIQAYLGADTPQTLHWHIAEGSCADNTDAAFDPLDQAENPLCETATEKFSRMKACPMGNLTAKHGDLVIASNSSAFVGGFVDSNLNLGWSPNVRRRALVLTDASGESFDCAELQDACTASPRVMTASVTHNLFQTDFKFTQASASCPTQIELTVSTISSCLKGCTVAADPYNWQIHTYSALDVSKMGGVFAISDSLLDGGICNSTSPQSCALGDLSGKFGALDSVAINLESLPIKLHFTDFHLPLFGSASVFGRALTVSNTASSAFSLHDTVGSPYDSMTASLAGVISGDIVFGIHDTTAFITSTGLTFSGSGSDPWVTWGIFEHASVNGPTNCAGYGDIVASLDATAACDITSLEWCAAGDLSGKFGTLAIQSPFLLEDSTLVTSSVYGKSLVVSVNGQSVCATIGGRDAALCAFKAKNYDQFQSEFPSVGAFALWDGNPNTTCTSADGGASTTAWFESQRYVTYIHVLPSPAGTLVGTTVLGVTDGAATENLYTFTAEPAPNSYFEIPVGGDTAYIGVQIVSSSAELLEVSDVVIYTQCTDPADVSGVDSLWTIDQPSLNAAYISTSDGLTESGSATSSSAVAFHLEFDRITSFSEHSVSMTNCANQTFAGVRYQPLVSPCSSVCDAINGCNMTSTNITFTCFQFLFELLGCSTHPDSGTAGFAAVANLTLPQVAAAVVTSVQNSGSCSELTCRNSILTQSAVDQTCASYVWSSAGCTTIDVPQNSYRNLEFGTFLVGMLEWPLMGLTYTQALCYGADLKFEIGCDLVDGEVTSLLFAANSTVDIYGLSVANDAMLSVLSDQTPPKIVEVSFSTNNQGGNAYARAGNVITILVTASEPLDSLVMLRGNTQFFFEQLTDTRFSAQYTVLASDSGWFQPTLKLTDISSNNNVTTVPSNVLIDNTPPSVTINVLSETYTQSRYLASSTLNFAITVSETQTTFDLDTMTNITGCTSRVVQTTAAMDNFTVTCSGLEDGDVVTISFASGSVVTDVAGNSYTLTPSTVTLEVDLVPPTIVISSLSLDSCSASTSSNIQIRVSASEPVEINPAVSSLFTGAAVSSSVTPTEIFNEQLMFTVSLGSGTYGSTTIQAIEAAFLDRARHSSYASNSLFASFGELPAVDGVVIQETDEMLFYDTIYNDQDSLTIFFSSDTNTAGVCSSCSASSAAQGFSCDQKLSKAWIDEHFAINGSLGANYTGQWDSCSEFEIIIQNATGHSPNMSTINIQPRTRDSASDCSQRLRNKYNTSPAAKSSPVWGAETITSSYGACVYGSADPNTGACVCDDTHIGSDCNTKCVFANTVLTVGSDDYKLGTCSCDVNWYTVDCSFKCVSSQGVFFSLHPTYGTNACVCNVGSFGDMCETLCGAGTYVPENGDSCVPCPAGTYSTGPTAECTPCAANTYQPNTNQTSCLACPTHTSTRGRTGISSQLNCFADNGYFLTQSGDSFQVVKCSQPERCQYWSYDYDSYSGTSTWSVGESGQWCSQSSYYGSCVQCRCDESNSTISNTNKQCYTGYMCGRCRDGYYTLADICARCPAPQIWVFVVLAVGTAALLFGFYKISPYMDSTGSISSFFNFFQMVSLFQLFNVDLPAALRSMMDVLSFFFLNLQLTQPECRSAMLRKYENRFLITMGIPIGVGVLFLLFFVSRVVWKRLTFMCAWRYEIHEHRKRLSSAVANEPAFVSDEETGPVVPPLEGIFGPTKKPSLARQISIRGRMLQREAVQIMNEKSWANSNKPHSESISSLKSDPIARHAYIQVRKRFEPQRKQARFRQILDAAALREEIHDATNVAYTLNMCTNAYLTFLSVIYMMLVAQILAVFACTWQPDLGEYRLDAEPSIQCFTTHGPWGTMLWGSVPGIVLYVIGIPAFFATLLWRNRHRLDNSEVRARYGFLYQRFTRGWFWWELCVSSRKFLFVVVQLFTGSFVHFSMSCCLIVLFASVCFHLYAMPYNSNLLNKLEAVLLMGTSVILLAFLQLTDSEFNNTQGAILAIVVVIMVCVLGFVSVYVVLIEFRRRANDMNESLPFWIPNVFKRGLLARKKLVKELEEKSAQFLDKPSHGMFVSWLMHNATFADIQIWLNFMRNFAEFEATNEDRHLFERNHMPIIKTEKIPVFWHWLSKAKQHEILGLTRALTHLRLFKRWQRANEERVQLFVINQIKEEVFLSSAVDPSLPASSRRWLMLRRAVITGRWRNWKSSQDVQTARAQNTARGWFAAAFSALPTVRRTMPQRMHEFALERMNSSERRRVRATDLSSKREIERIDTPLEVGGHMSCNPPPASDMDMTPSSSTSPSFELASTSDTLQS